ncbi:MAG: putative peptidoglycan glycosyltransferase FtsW [Elusimicrobiota bacterium]
MSYASKLRKKTSYYHKGLNMRFFDYGFFSAVIALSLFSLITLYSVTSVTSPKYVQKQIIWHLAGFSVMIFVSFSDLKKIREYVSFFNLGVLFILLITLFMPPIQNVRRWVPLGFMNLQTSELAKLACVFFLADFSDRNYSGLSNMKILLKPALIISGMLLLIALQPDLGTPALIFAVALFSLYTAGVKPLYLFAPIIAAIPLAIIEIYRHPYRLVRLKTFLSPWENAKNETYQLAQSLIAIGSGGWFGVGPGASSIKLKYLPEAHTDFIFPIIAEEFGFMGSLILLTAFIYLLKRSLKIAATSSDYFYSCLALFSGFMIVFQALFNISMTAGMIPTKGLPLPFFSYGGTSIMITMILCGFILNASRNRSQS